jgi:hypothetical protein
VGGGSADARVGRRALPTWFPPLPSPLGGGYGPSASLWPRGGCAFSEIALFFLSASAAFGFDERTGAAWWARSGHQGPAVQEYWVEHPRDLGQGQADERRVKKHGGLVWIALSMRVAWTSCTGTATPDRALVFVTTVNCGATPCAITECFSFFSG